VPKYSDQGCFDRIGDIVKYENIDVVFPSIHEGLFEWSKRRETFIKDEVFVVISPVDTTAICHDKWNLYKFFMDNDIPTPRTSLKHEYELIKPRVGRGGAGIKHVSPKTPVDMESFISQEIIEGQEYSIDALCDLQGKVLCVVPRKRIVVESGLSIKGQVVEDKVITNISLKILASAHFIGPVNIQCFKNKDGIFFTEINPRLAGGMSLSMYATGNWFDLIFRMMKNEVVAPQPVNYGLIMMRHYSDVIIEEKELIQK